MEILQVAFQYITFWLVIHAVFYLISQKLSSSERHWFHTKPFNISWRTSVFNNYFLKITNTYVPRLWHAWFQLGSIVTICVMFIGTFIVVRSSYEILQIIYAYGYLAKAWLRMEKREFRLLEHQQHGTLLPMIPGLTLPLHHIHYYFIALLVGALVHELGHGLCASSYGLSLRYFGMFFTYLYPGAFISIAEADLETLERWQKLQVACAGIWHNIVLCGICKLLNMASEWIWCNLGWTHLVKTEGRGVSVVQIHANSPLREHLAAGVRIMQLDDTPITRGLADWEEFWSMDFTLPPEKGFCTMLTSKTNDTQCCEFASDLPFGNSSDVTISCFQNIAYNNTEVIQGECLYTLQTLASAHTTRCNTDSECVYNNTCVVPVTPSMFGQRVRIFAERDGKEYITSIYEGSLRDVLDSVQVSNLHPKYAYLPTRLPHQFNLLTSYIATFSLALALLNSVPAFSLDGVSILRKLLIAKQKLLRVITKLMTGIVLFVIIGSVFILLLQKI